MGSAAIASSHPWNAVVSTSAGEAGYLWYFDFDGDGDVDGRDNGQFNRRRLDRDLFRSAFGKRAGEAGYFDFDGDGDVDGRDNGNSAIGGAGSYW